MGSVIKKRGRPAGSKNKPKKIIMTRTQVDLAKKAGVPIESYAKEMFKLSRGRKPVNAKFDWEKIAKRLQTALNDEIKENQGLANEVSALQYKVANLEHQAIGYRAIVSYLENKLGNDTV